MVRVVRAPVLREEDVPRISTLSQTEDSTCSSSSSSNYTSDYSDFESFDESTEVNQEKEEDNSSDNEISIGSTVSLDSNDATIVVDDFVMSSPINNKALVLLYSSPDANESGATFQPRISESEEEESPIKNTQTNRKRQIVLDLSDSDSSLEQFSLDVPQTYNEQTVPSSESESEQEEFPAMKAIINRTRKIILDSSDSELEGQENKTPPWSECEPHVSFTPQKVTSIPSPSKFFTPKTQLKPSKPPKTIFKTPKSHVHSKLSLKVRESLVRDLFQEFNEKIFGNSLPNDLEIEWSTRLNKTAGKAHCEHKKAKDGQYKLYCKVQLASKVTDTEYKVRNTFAHELCHIAVFYFHGFNQPAHGKVFREYADEFERVYSRENVGTDLQIIVSTCHSYDIDYKYRYICSNDTCGIVYGRHSKSIDTQMKGCGYCKSKLVLYTRNNERVEENATKVRKDGTPVKPNKYREFVKENFSMMREKLGKGVTHKDVMQALGKEWRHNKDEYI